MTEAMHRRKTSVYTIEFPGDSDAVGRAADAAQQIVSLAGSGLYGPGKAYLRVRVADDSVALWAASESLGGTTPTFIHTGVGVHRRALKI